MTLKNSIKLLSIMGLIFSGVTLASTDLKGRLVLTGSSTVAPLVSEMGKKFESLHPEVRIDVQTGGSSRGILDARQGTANIGMISRSLKSQEKDLKFFTIAKDGICIILHQSNIVKTLTNDQIKNIFLGKITNWKQVGGADRAITVVNKAEGRSTLELFLKYFSLKNSQIKAQVIIGDNEQGIKTISGNEGSIGYVSIGAAKYSFENSIPIKLLPISGVDASIENVANGRFPLSRSLNLVTKEKPKGLEKEFIKFAQSEQVFSIIKEQNFVPITQ